MIFASGQQCEINLVLCKSKCYPDVLSGCDSNFGTWFMLASWAVINRDVVPQGNEPQSTRRALYSGRKG